MNSESEGEWLPRGRQLSCSLHLPLLLHAADINCPKPEQIEHPRLEKEEPQDRRAEAAAASTPGTALPGGAGRAPAALGRRCCPIAASARDLGMRTEHWGNQHRANRQLFHFTPTFVIPRNRSQQ